MFKIRFDVLVQAKTSREFEVGLRGRRCLSVDKTFYYELVKSLVFRNRRGDYAEVYERYTTIQLNTR